MTQHTNPTPGPWKGEATEMSEADMRLYAAAPDLLAAVQDLVELRDHPSRYSVGDVNKRYERARAAIAKAEAAP